MTSAGTAVRCYLTGVSAPLHTLKVCVDEDFRVSDAGPKVGTAASRREFLSHNAKNAAFDMRAYHFRVKVAHGRACSSITEVICSEVIQEYFLEIHGPPIYPSSHLVVEDDLRHEPTNRS